MKVLTLILIGLLIIACRNEIRFKMTIIDPAESSPAKPYGKAMGDINGDGQSDLLVSSAAGEGMYWYDYPEWTRKAIRTTGSWSEDCQIADIDNDGDNDVINGNKEGLFWYENQMDTGSDWKEHYIGSDGTNIHDLEVADLNSDGKKDFAIRYEKENKRPVIVFLQVNPEKWKEVTNTNTTNLKGEGLALGDLDGDFDIDIAIGNVWLENSADGNKWTEHQYFRDMPEQLILKIADIDMDGWPEIIAAPQSSQTGDLAWYKAGTDRNPLWAEHIIEDNITRMHGLGVSDFNLDGFPDIHTSVRHDKPGERHPVSIWISNGDDVPGFTKQVIANTGSHFSKIGDIDSDGDLDIFGANWSGENDLRADVILWRNLLRINK